MATTYLGPERRVRVRRNEDTCEVEATLVAVEISTDHIREAVLWAVANGWKPEESRPFDDTSSGTLPDERPTLTDLRTIEEAP